MFELMSVVNIEIMKLFHWFCAIKLSLFFLVFFILFRKAHKHCRSTDFKVTIDKVTFIIERVSTTNNLGVYIDEDLNWKYHASQISLKISRSLGILNCVRFILTHELLKSLYYNIIHHLLPISSAVSLPK